MAFRGKILVIYLNKEKSYLVRENIGSSLLFNLFNAFTSY